LISLPQFFNENTKENLRLLKMIDKTLYRALIKFVFPTGSVL